MRVVQLVEVIRDARPSKSLSSQCLHQSHVNNNSASRNSYDTPESEEDEANPDPYPLEGKYKDEEDRQWFVIPVVLKLGTHIHPQVDVFA